MNIEIKRADLNDLETLIKWRITVLKEVFELPEDYDLTVLKSENRLYYQEQLNTGGHIACFAYNGEKIVGCGGVCIYSEMPSPDNPSGKCAYLMNIYTAPEWRKNGVGKRIVEWLVDKARNLKITKIYLETSDAGRELYKSLGFGDMNGFMIM